MKKKTKVILATAIIFSIIIFAVHFYNEWTSSPVYADGKITAYTADEAGRLKTFTVYANEKEITFVPDGRTTFTTFTDDFLEEDFYTKDITNYSVSITYFRNDKLNSTEGAFFPHRIWLHSIIEIDGASLADGTMLDVEKKDWQDKIYLLKDGTELLIDHGTVFSEGEISQLDEAVQDKIINYYNSQPPYYSVEEQLEFSYAEYKNSVSYEANLVGRHIYPIHTNDTIICMLTEITLPKESYDTEQHNTIERFSTMQIFDVKTGEIIPNDAIFNRSLQEVLKTYFDMGYIKSEKAQKDMLASITPDNIILHSNSLQIQFPAGSLPSEENTFIIVENISDEFAKTVLHSWALPDNINQ